MSSDAVIEISQLNKSFGKFAALNGLDLTVERGQIHGFLGPNGAGKSTTIRVLLGLLKADSGHATVLGKNPWTDSVELHRRLAYVPGDVALWPNMTGGEAIDLLGKLRGGLNETRRAELVERFELDPTKRGRQYSKGNRQKVAIVAALASDCELLILDEPTSGLDPLMERVFQEEITAAQDRGASVLLSSHILSELESLADRLSIIRDGAIVQAGTLAELRGHIRTSIHASVEPPLSVEADAALLAPFHDIKIHGTQFSATVEADHVGAAVAGLASRTLTSLVVEPPSLEALFLKLYEAGGDAGAPGVAGDAGAPGRSGESTAAATTAPGSDVSAGAPKVPGVPGEAGAPGSSTESTAVGPTADGPTADGPTDAEARVIDESPTLGKHGIES